MRLKGSVFSLIYELKIGASHSVFGVFLGHNDEMTASKVFARFFAATDLFTNFHMRYDCKISSYK